MPSLVTPLDPGAVDELERLLAARDGLKDALYSSDEEDFESVYVALCYIEPLRRAYAALDTTPALIARIRELEGALGEARKGLSALLLHPLTPQSGACFEQACTSMGAIDAALKGQTQ